MWIMDDFLFQQWLNNGSDVVLKSDSLLELDSSPYF